MRQVDSVKILREQVRDWHRQDLKIAFVPTMGNLHQGHLELVRQAKQVADKVVVSIFVNPMQFSAGEDLDKYPRTEARDKELLQGLDTDLLFLPAVEEVYPTGQQQQTRVEVPGLSDRLCGASRPGHFTGVATVVCKLFNMVQPDVAVFGEKDFQQLAVIRKMIDDLNMPVEIIGMAIVREADGLAMSSRNGYLDAQQRQQAVKLYQTLQAVEEQIRAGDRNYPVICLEAEEKLRVAGFKPDYLEVCQASTLLPAQASDPEIVILAAAWMGDTRLIDNIQLKL